MNIPIKVESEFVQVCHLRRFTDNTILLCNINQMFGLEIRKWQLTELNHYDGFERISQILTLNKSEFIVGNRERSFQVWKSS